MKFALLKAIKSINKPWKSVDLVKFDNKVLRIALFKGEYKEHSHDYEEVFLVYKGKITIQTDNGPVELSKGDGVAIPKGVKHKAIAHVPSFVLFIDE